MIRELLPDYDWEYKEPPKYSDKGRILFRLWPILLPDFWWQKNEIEVLDYDNDSSVLWLHDGIGIDHVLQDLELEEGTYVVEDVHGQYFCYDGPNGRDDNEEWYLGDVRRASEEEMRSGTL